MKKGMSLDKSKNAFPLSVFALGVCFALALLIGRLNIIAIALILYCCLTSAIILLGLLTKKKVYAFIVFGYAAACAGLALYYIIWGADGGFGAFSSGLAGFSTAEHPLLTGKGNIFTRLLGNFLLMLPGALCLWGLFFTAKKVFRKNVIKTLLTFILSTLLVLASVAYVFTFNLRSKPNTVRLWEGHDDYLNGVSTKSAGEKPNVLIILMDDLGYGDISLNGAIYETPNIDSIGENGIALDNFYSSYSVCSPARFAALTGRYPYRGYADNVVYPTVNTLSPLATTRVFNSIEMGANADGMLGDEITLAEVMKSAGYNTGLFGKWHLGDYGEYLPTNQGFDYFYGAHAVNDMTPFYHAKEAQGEYTVVHGTNELKDQSKATEYIHNEITDWITQQANKDNPFFAYYASPWPHAPVFAGEKFQGATGMGTYVDCITEFDAYLGELFDTMEKLGVLDDTIIVFTSDNGPALEGSTDILRGGKYLAYEGGQKVPFLIRWDKANGALGETGTHRSQSATLVDLFPTLINLCGITDKDGNKNYLPSDRVIDGVSMAELLKNDGVIHTAEHPILHMKREDIKAIQYTVPTEAVKNTHPNYNYSVLNENEYITFKFFDRIQNDNSAFFDKYRKNWLHILNDDAGENYNRSVVYPGIAKEFGNKLNEIQKNFKENRRGILK